MAKLLLLDDEPEIGSIVRDIAEEFGFDSVLTTAPDEFVAAFAERRPDMILLDLVFPGSDGIEMLRFLEAERYKGSLILMSGMDSRVIGTARRLGQAIGLDVLGSIQKPFPAADLRELLAKFAERNPVFSAADLRGALADGEIAVHFQPVVDMASRAILGVESLVRWFRPEGRLVMPDKFIPYVAREGLMSEMTWSVLESALTQAEEWRRNGEDIRLAVNVPASVIHDPGFFDHVATIRRKFHPANHRLMFELTETEAMGDPVRTMEVLSRLRLAGIDLAIDDFGTGYSSLVELRRLPVTYLKIDKSFVLSCISEADGAAITQAVIELSHVLGLKVVAEGVENAPIWDRLVSWGCDAAQGYHIARAMPGAEVLRWAADWRHRSAGKG